MNEWRRREKITTTTNTQGFFSAYEVGCIDVENTNCHRRNFSQNAHQTFFLKFMIIHLIQRNAVVARGRHYRSGWKFPTHCLCWARFVEKSPFRRTRPENPFPLDRRKKYLQRRCHTSMEKPPINYYILIVYLYWRTQFLVGSLLILLACCCCFVVW